MTASLQRLRARQLDELLGELKPLITLRPPRQGWIQAIRTALGMTTSQLAKRMDITQPSVSAMEKNEARGAISLSKLQKAAEAINCDLVYALVPRESLQVSLERQVRQVVWQRIKRTAHTMALEEQAVPDSHLRAQVEEMVQQAMSKLPPNLWD
ncbi:MAG: antitoxin, family [Gemmatimonadetes bacterium]|nr:antitoxin, family [Gemmatimonadota bacterium]